jgi:hypothetical protein
MKILNVAICVLLLFSISPVQAEDIDWKRLTTKTGRVYRNVQLLVADDHGLLFRHSKGIAKENYWVLSDDIRKNYEPEEKAPAEKGEEKAEAVLPFSDIVLTFAIRQPIVQQPCFDPCYLAYHHPWHPNPSNWPRHWHRFHHAHYLTNPHYRALATRNFLYDVGLLRPFGPVHHRFRH